MCALVGKDVEGESAAFILMPCVINLTGAEGIRWLWFWLQQEN